MKRKRWLMRRPVKTFTINCNPYQNRIHGSFRVYNQSWHKTSSQKTIHPWSHHSRPMLPQENRLQVSQIMQFWLSYLRLIWNLVMESNKAPHLLVTLSSSLNQASVVTNIIRIVWIIRKFLSCLSYQSKNTWCPRKNVHL